MNVHEERGYFVSGGQGEPQWEDEEDSHAGGWGRTLRDWKIKAGLKGVLLHPGNSRADNIDDLQREGDCGWVNREVRYQIISDFESPYRFNMWWKIFEKLSKEVTHSY